jgi:hypothetical protein
MDYLRRSTAKDTKEDFEDANETSSEPNLPITSDSMLSTANRGDFSSNASYSANSFDITHHSASVELPRISRSVGVRR